MLLEDEHGQVNLIVPPHVYERHRATVRPEPLVLARGRYERVGENRNVLVSELESLGPLARQVAENDTVWESLPRPHSFGRRYQPVPRRRSSAAGGSARTEHEDARASPRGSARRAHPSRAAQRVPPQLVTAKA